MSLPDARQEPGPAQRKQGIHYYLSPKIRFACSPLFGPLNILGGKYTPFSADGQRFLLIPRSQQDSTEPLTLDKTERQV